MQLPVMASAKRHRELVADFQANAARLRKSQMMRVARLSPADQARLRCNELEMRLVTQPFGFSNGELALIDPSWNRIGPVRGQVAELTMSVFAQLNFFAAGPSTAHIAGGRSNATALELALCHRDEIQSAGLVLPDSAPMKLES
jgi:hypothetical protein